MITISNHYLLIIRRFGNSYIIPGKTRKVTSRRSTTGKPPIRILLSVCDVHGKIHPNQ